MDHKKTLEAIKQAREKSNKRKFVQTFDLFVNVRGLDLKKPVNQIDLILKLPHFKGKKPKVCAFVDKHEVPKAKEVCDVVIQDSEFDKYNSKKAVVKLADKCDVFIAQANLMPDIAKIFGRYLGPRRKMPNPKMGQVFAPQSNIGDIIERQRYMVSLVAKTQPVVHVSVGTEDMKDEEVAKNIERVIDTLVEKFPQGEHNVKSAYLKLTMGGSVKVW